MLGGQEVAEGSAPLGMEESQAWLGCFAQSAQCQCLRKVMTVKASSPMFVGQLFGCLNCSLAMLGPGFKHL